MCTLSNQTVTYNWDKVMK